MKEPLLCFQSLNRYPLIVRDGAEVSCLGCSLAIASLRIPYAYVHLKLICDADHVERRSACLRYVTGSTIGSYGAVGLARRRSACYYLAFIATSR